MLGYVHIPTSDLFNCTHFSQELFLTLNPYLSRHEEVAYISNAISPSISISYLCRQGLNDSRQKLMERCIVDHELLLVKAAIRAALDEKSTLSDLFNQLSSDPAGVAAAIANYFNTLKKEEKNIMTGKKGKQAGNVVGKCSFSKHSFQKKN